MNEYVCGVVCTEANSLGKQSFIRIYLSSSLLFDGKLSPGLGLPSWIIPPNIVAASNSTTCALDCIDKHVPTDQATKRMEINILFPVFHDLQ